MAALPMQTCPRCGELLADIKGSRLAVCRRCGYKDDYAAAFETRVLPADVLIFAGPVRDRYPPLLRALAARDVHGFLMGFVDLVFTHGESRLFAGDLARHFRKWR